MEPAVQHLLDNGKITRGQLGEARRTQQFFGGQLASHLLKLGFVDEESLGAALSAVTGRPYASFDTLRAVAAEAQERLPERLLETHRACPIGIEGGVLRIAMLNPRDGVAIRELEKVSGLQIEPWVTTEYRLYQALERYYRIRLDGLRALSLAPPAEMRKRRLREGARDVSEEDGAGAGEQPAEAELGLDGLPLDADPDEARLWGGDASATALDSVEELPGDRPPLQAVEAPSATRADPGPAPRPETAAGTLSELGRTLAAGPDRVGISRAVLEFCSAHARRVALFAVSRDRIRGIGGRGGSFDDDLLENVTVPRERSAMLEQALDSVDGFYGSVPPERGSREIYDLLDGRVPPTVAIFPVRVKERPVALLYLDNESQPLPPPNETLRRVALKTGLALEILILRNKLQEL